MRLKSSGALTVCGTFLSSWTQLCSPGAAQHGSLCYQGWPSTAALSADTLAKMVSIVLKNHRGRGAEYCWGLQRGLCGLQQLDHRKQLFSTVQNVLCRVQHKSLGEELY